MNRLHMSWSELQEEPAEVYRVFRAFILGENDAGGAVSNDSVGVLNALLGGGR